MRRAIVAAVLGLMAATGARARAEWTVNFRYSGRGGPDFAGLISTGAGSFSFAGGLSTVGLTDLTSFDFTLDETTPNTATFGLTNLTSFSAAVGPGTTLTSLALATGPVQGTNPETERREFTVSSLGPQGASTSFVLLGLPFSLTQGSVTIVSVVPEPSSLALAAFGALIVADGLRRGRRRRGAGAGVIAGRVGEAAG
jgi:hypothetical protein